MNNRPIKVVHISSYINGGAGIAAYRLHKALQKEGIDSAFLCLDSSATPDDTVFKMVNPKQPILFRAFKKLVSFFSRDAEAVLNVHAKDIRLLKQLYPSLRCGFASLPFSNYNILTHPIVNEADIIHLHWVAGMLDYPSFFKNNLRPVVWTMHDMNPIKGLYHYDEDEKRNEAVTKDFDQRMKHLKDRVIQNRRCPMEWITPSKWLEGEVKSSATFKQVAGQCIPNCIDTGIFTIQDTSSLKASLNIEPSQTVLLFVAEAVNDYRKGFDLLVQALSELKDLPVTLLVIGSRTVVIETNANVIALGSIQDQEKLSRFYSLADAYIIPSREDNLPNVMIEAMSCGTPVLSFNTGGMSTVIQNDFNGLKADNVSVTGMKQLIIDFISKKNQFNRELIRDFAKTNFGNEIISAQYNQVYKEVIALK